jgi:hypothetical protein
MLARRALSKARRPETSDQSRLPLATRLDVAHVSSLDSRLSTLRSPRTGATLTEVLMSLLIMSVGIVSVITIFPISLLRSIQATQLTNARLLRTNTEEELRLTFSAAVPLVAVNSQPTIDTRYDILNHSTMPIGSAIAPVASQIFRGYWQPGTAYAVGQVVLPTPRDIIAGTRTARWFQCFAAGVSGPSEPHWERAPFAAPQPIDDPPGGTLVWVAVDTNFVGSPATVPTGRPYQALDLSTFGLPEYDGLNYVVDPLGWNVLANDGANAFLLPAQAVWNDFGFQVNSGIATRRGLAANTRRLLRINGGAYNVALGETYASHPDSWSVGVTDTLAAPPALLATTATFQAGVDLSHITIGANTRHRIVLTSLVDPRVVTRDLTAIAGTVGTGFTVGWLNPLPPAFLADGPARLETYDRRYSWLATVNKDIQGHADVTVAVFFKRSLSVADEHAYTAISGTGGGMAFDDQFGISWDASPAPAEPIPLLKEGNYLFDATNATWYRIVAVTSVVAPLNGPGSATITVDRPVPPTQQKAGGAGRVMLMRGIVELFKL